MDEIDLMQEVAGHTQAINELFSSDSFGYDDMDRVREHWHAIVKLWDKWRYLCKKQKRAQDSEYNKKCKIRERKNSAKHYARNKNRVLGRQAKYYKDNKKIILKKRDQYYAKHQDEIIDKMREKRWEP